MNSTATLFAFYALSLVTLGAALGAVSLRNPVHCGLSLALAFVGVAGFYLLLGAEFVGFIQLLVYVGAVAVLIMFVILLTRPVSESPGISRKRLLRHLPGLGVGAAVFLALAISVLNSPDTARDAGEASEVSISALGEMLVTSHLLPLQITGVLLTAALVGAVLFALKEDS
jgi:NADH-quinone oxidoreductase subunit J